MADPRDAAELDPAQLDVVLAALFAGLALNERVTERLHADGFDDVRFSHGFVFQHLVPGSLAVFSSSAKLARRMGVLAEAASKAAAELEEAGLSRAAPRSRRRARPPARPERARRAAVEAGRAARAAVAEELAGALGPRRAERCGGRCSTRSRCGRAGRRRAARRVPPVR